MAQPVKVFATKPDIQCLILWTLAWCKCHKQLGLHGQGKASYPQNRGAMTKNDL